MASACAFDTAVIRTHRLFSQDNRVPPQGGLSPRLGTRAPGAVPFGIDPMEAVKRLKGVL